MIYLSFHAVCIKKILKYKSKYKIVFLGLQSDSKYLNIINFLLYLLLTKYFRILLLKQKLSFHNSI